MTRFAFEMRQKFEAVPREWESFLSTSDTHQRYNKYLTNLVFSVRTVSYGSSFLPLRFMARALRAWAINRGGKNSVCNLRYGPRTRLVRSMYFRRKWNHPTQWGYGLTPIRICKWFQLLAAGLIVCPQLNNVRFVFILLLWMYWMYQRNGSNLTELDGKQLLWYSWVQI